MLNQLPARVWNWFRGGNFPAGDDKFGAFPGVSTSTVMDAIFSPAVTGLSGLLQKSLRRISQSMMRATGLILCVNLLPTFWLLRAALPSEPTKLPRTDLPIWGLPKPVRLAFCQARRLL